MHRILPRILRKLGLTTDAPPSVAQWRQFLDRIDATYVEADENRYTMERSLTLVSEEMRALYQRQRESFEARQRAILNAQPDLLFLFDEDGRYLEILAGNSAQLFRPESELTGRLLTEVLPPEMAAYFLEVIRETLAKQEMQVVEYDLEVPAGTLHFEGRSVPADLVIKGRRSVVFLARDITELHDSRQQLTYAATHDGLTGLANRNLFSERLQQAISKNVRTGRTGAVLFLDLDRFKAVNDTLGHSVGDGLLREAATRLSTICRTEDTLARLGGDEFAVLLDEIEEASDADRVADKLLKTFERPFRLFRMEINSSASVGICHFPTSAKTAEETLRRADTAMYAAKEAGRSCYRVFSMDLEHGAVESFAMETDLRHAIENREFFLVWQPRMRLPARRLSGFEALIRWHHPTRGLVRPDRFIPLAEQCGMIHEIGMWVFEAVCRQAVAWRQAGYHFEHLSFNLSQRQLSSPQLVTQLSDVMRTTGADPTQLECEVTESVIIEYSELAQRNLQDLVDLGIRLAIDDFGTGHSSLINLKRFPISRIKIDQAFVRDVGKDPYDEAIIRATLGIAKGLGMAATAEGIETEVQETFLIALGCEEGQGYYYGRPVVAAEAEQRLLEAAIPGPEEHGADLRIRRG